MRRRCSLRAKRAFAAVSLAALAGGCSAGVSREPFATASLPPRPEEGMAYAPPPAYAQTGTLGYSPPPAERYSPPPAERYNPPYAERYSYRPPVEPRREPSYMQTGSLGNTREPLPQPYSANRWSDAANPTGPIQPVPPVDNPNPMRWHAGARPGPATIPQSAIPADSQIIQVREGDTIYGLARRYRVPVAELVSVNRIYGGRLDVGQKLVVPADPR